MFKRTFVFRIFILNFFLLVVPTFLWLAFFFEKVKKDSIKETFYHLEDVAVSMTSRIEDSITFHNDILKILISDLALDDPEALKQEDLIVRLKDLSARVPAFGILTYAKKMADGRFVIWASTYYDAGIDVTDREFISAALTQQGSMTLGFGPQGPSEMFIARTITTKESDVSGILAIGIDPHRYLTSLIGVQYVGSSVRFQLRSVEGINFAADDPSYNQSTALPLTEQQIEKLFMRGIIDRKELYCMPIVPLQIPPFKNIFEVNVNGIKRIGVNWPIPHSNAVFAVSVDKEDLWCSFHSHLWKSLSIAAFAGFVSSMIIWLLVKRFSKPLAQFTQVMQEVASDNLQSRFARDKIGYEMNVVGEAVNNMLDSLAVQIETIRKAPIARALAEKELKIGHQIQQKILPNVLPTVANLSLAAVAKSCLEMGGDFYDVFLHEQDGRQKLFFVVADGAGKGISACLYSLGLRSMLRSYAMASESVSVTVKEANNLFSLDAASTAMFATIFAAILDPETLQFDYYAAGHPPALLRHKDGTIEKLWTAGTPLGIAPIESISEQSTQLKPGDVLLLYTDGVTEAMNSQGVLYGEQRLMNFLKNRSPTTPTDDLACLLQDIASFAADAKQNDDITAVLIHISEFSGNA